MSPELLTMILLWFVRAFVSSLICLLLGFIGIRSLDFITSEISEFRKIKGDPLATGLFVSGFFIFAGLVVYGSMVNPFFLGQSVIFGSYFNLERLLIVVLSFLVSMVFGWVFYIVFAKLKPFGIDLDDVNKSPLAVGVFVFSFEVFLGLIMLASLLIPLA
ncbi:MAG: hypothetical protein LUP94_01955 [Candidatus Methanomethylicus sp.]|nr:hypothetical protein [Candidatus Methanomethylicus sp.]